MNPLALGFLLYAWDKQHSGKGKRKRKGKRKHKKRWPGQKHPPRMEPMQPSPDDEREARRKAKKKKRLEEEEREARRKAKKKKKKRETPADDVENEDNHGEKHKEEPHEEEHDDDVDVPEEEPKDGDDDVEDHHDEPPRKKKKKKKRHVTTMPVQVITAPVQDTGGRSVDDLQKILVGLGWRGHLTTRRATLSPYLKDGLYGDTVHDNWQKSATGRGLDPAIVQTGPDTAQVNPATFSALKAAAGGSVVGSIYIP